MYKSVAFPKVHNEICERDNPCKSGKKLIIIIKYLGMFLIEEVKNLQWKLQDFDEINWRRNKCSWIVRINIVKMYTLVKAIYRFN